MNRTHAFALVLILVSAVGIPQSAGAVCQEAPLIPNPTFTGTGGAAQGTTGPVPDFWRAFVTGTGGVVSTEIVPVDADALYPGSPPTRALKFTVTTRGTDQGFDVDSNRFAVDPMLRYFAEFYVKSGNPDNSSQGFSFGFPVYDANGVYLSRNPGASPTTSTATSTWQKVRGRSWMDPTAKYAGISFRLASASASGSFMVALPSVTATSELAPNAGFDRTGNGGTRGGGTAMTGLIPDHWRAFAVSGSTAQIDIVPLAADALFPGSAATNAVRFTVTAHVGDEGFDAEVARFSIFPNLTYQGSFYLKTGNADNSDQDFRFNTPVFSGPAYDASSASVFLGREPGAITGTATASWQLVTTPAFQDAEALSGKIGWRLGTGMPTGSIMIALPSMRATNADDNLVPNELFAGSGGLLFGGGATGTVPDLWRAVAITGTAEAPVLNNPSFENDIEGTSVVADGSVSVTDTTTINGWRFFATGTAPDFAAGSATVTSAAASQGGKGMQLVRNNAVGSSALDMDASSLREVIPPQQRIYRLMVDARDGGPQGGTATLGLSLQFADSTYNRGITVDPAGVFEPFGLTARSDTGKSLSVRMDLGTAVGSADLDNVQLTDVTGGADRLANGGFENSASTLSQWRFFATGSAAGSAALSSDVHAGSSAAALDITAIAAGEDIGLDLANRVAALAGEQVTITFWAKKVSAGDTRIKLNLAAYAANGTYIGEPAKIVANPGTGAYEMFTVTATVPANAYLLNIGFRVVDAAELQVPGSYLLDDVSLVGASSYPFAPAAAEASKGSLAVDEIYPGSPAGSSLTFRQTQFGANGGDAQLDHDNFRFAIKAGQEYQGGVYVKSANSDAADQQLTVGFRLYNGTSLVGETAAVTATTGSAWQLVSTDKFQSATATSAGLVIRLVNDGGADNAITVALPWASPVILTGNRVPNPTFAGAGGSNNGVAGGPVPDNWRAFAVSGATAEMAVVPVEADALYSGSPATNAVLWRRTGFLSGDAAFDHEPTKFPMVPGTRYQAAVYVKSGNLDGSSQQFRLNFPVFKGGVFLGREPGVLTATAGSSWQLIVGPSFADSEADSGNIGFRVMDDGGENAIMVALPSVDVSCPMVFAATPQSGSGVLNDVLITGSGFAAGAGTTVGLSREGQPDIIATQVRVGDQGNLLANFDLTGAAVGAWDVVVCVNGCAGTLPGGFTISGCARQLAGDADGDGDVDQDDVAEFQRCYTQDLDPSGTFDSETCTCFDWDQDHDVDGNDFLHFMECASGPEIPANVNCSN